MKPFTPKRLTLASLLVAIVIVAGVSGVMLAGKSTAGSWTTFGGPHRDFQADSSGLASEWPEAGPSRLWSRELGDGYSAILVEADRLYTMYRADDKQEVVVALEAASGKTIWEYPYDASPRDGHVDQFGRGPRATPLISGNRIYTIGISGVMNCLDKRNGKPQWSHDLWGEEFGGTFLNHGYSSSPIEYKDTVIALVGGQGASIVAFNKKNGKVAWKALDFENSYSTPKVFEIDGREQLITFMATEIIGVDPNNGKLLWEMHHENQWKQNVNMPVMTAGNYLFFSSTDAGAKGVRLSNQGDKTEVEEVWSTRKIQFYHVSSVRQGDWVYGSTGAGAPNFMAGVNIKTGEIAWRKRGFAKANVVAADGKLLILDEDGKLALATATPQDLEVHSEVDLLDERAWTVPTVVGKTMYVRDRSTIMALDLG